MSFFIAMPRKDPNNSVYYSSNERLEFPQSNEAPALSSDDSIDMLKQKPLNLDDIANSTFTTGNAIWLHML